MRIPEEKIADIRDNSDIVEVISEYLTLKKSGINYRAVCPFHSEKTPSFFVNPSKQIYHCFGCGEGGNVFSFLMKIENVTFIEAVKLLAEKRGIELSDYRSENIDSKEEKEKKEILRLNEYAAELYHSILLKDKQGENALKYLSSRSITEETILKFKLGYAPLSWDFILEKATKQGFKQEILMKAGLILNSSDGKKMYDRFRGRIIFPIQDSKSKIVGFGGRVIVDSDSAKYVNSPDTPVYHKSHILYGWNFARDSVLKNSEVVLVEGYFDCIMCHQHGIENVVATLGTALTDGHAGLLKRYVNNCVICYDVDFAGEKASLRGVDLLVEKGFLVRICSLPESKDPDEYLRKHNKESFNENLKNSKNIVKYCFRRESIKTTEDKIRVVNSILPLLAKVNNEIELGEYVAELSKESGVEERLLWNELSKVKTMSNTGFKPVASIKGKETATAVEKAENELICLMFETPTLINSVKNELTTVEFTNLLNQKIIKILYDLTEQGKSPTIKDVIDIAEDNFINKKLSEIAFSEYVPSNYDKAVKSLIEKIKKHHYEKRRKELLKLLHTGQEEVRNEYNKLNKILHG